MRLKGYRVHHRSCAPARANSVSRAFGDDPGCELSSPEIAADLTTEKATAATIEAFAGLAEQLEALSAHRAKPLWRLLAARRF
jgi:hypothetical protein